MKRPVVDARIVLISILNKYGREYGQDLCDSRYGPVVESCNTVGLIVSKQSDAGNFLTS